MSEERVTHHFKTMENLRGLIQQYELALARPTRKLSHPTLYRTRDVNKNDKLIKGVREKDWFFSSDGLWVLPHDQMGLSFSSNWQHLKGAYKMKEKHSSGSAVNVYWVLETADLPADMKFEPDRQKKGHYLLTVTKQMTLYELIGKLKWLADRMSVMKDARRAL